MALLTIGLCFCLKPQWAAASETKPFYEVHLGISPEAGQAEVNLTLTVPAEYIHGNELTFLFSSDADITTFSGDHLAGFSAVEAGPGLSLYTLQFENIPEYGISMEMAYTLGIPANHPINRISEDWIELNIDTFWHPVLTSFSRFEYQLTTDLDARYHILTGDVIAPLGEHRVIESVIPRIDIAFTAAQHLFTLEGEFSRVYSTNPATNLDSLLHLSEQALAFLKRYTARTDDFNQQRIVVESPRDDVGYARDNYVVLSRLQDMDAVTLSGFLAHEFTHYWFSTADPQSQDHWLNESFAEFLSMIFIREIYGDAAYDADIAHKRLRIKQDPRPLDAFEGRPSHIAMYYTGPLVLHYFEVYTGADAFRSLILQMIERRVTTTDELLALIASELGDEAKQKMIELRSRTVN